MSKKPSYYRKESPCFDCGGKGYTDWQVIDKEGLHVGRSICDECDGLGNIPEPMELYASRLVNIIISQKASIAKLNKLLKSQIRCVGNSHKTSNNH